MSRFYESIQFRELNKEWRERLVDSGFEDQEDEKENLKQYDRRTIAFDNHKRIRDFFIKLESYLTNTPNIPQAHRQILELFCQGMHVKGKDSIVSRTGRSDKTVRNVIKKYKDIVLST